MGFILVLLGRLFTIIYTMDNFMSLDSEYLTGSIRILVAYKIWTWRATRAIAVEYYVKLSTLRRRKRVTLNTRPRGLVI